MSSKRQVSEALQQSLFIQEQLKITKDAVFVMQQELAKTAIKSGSYDKLFGQVCEASRVLDRQVDGHENALETLFIYSFLLTSVSEAAANLMKQVDKAL